MTKIDRNRRKLKYITKEGAIALFGLGLLWGMVIGLIL